MYSVPSPPWSSSPAAASPTTTSSPSSSSRSSRLRGLSYLRSYTQNHILSRESHNHNNNHNHSSASHSRPSSQRPSVLSRATSYPSPTSPGNRGSGSGSGPAAAVTRNNTRQTSPASHRSPTELPIQRSSDPEISGSTSANGWLRSLGGQRQSQSQSQPPSTGTSSSSAVLSQYTSSVVATDPTAFMARTRSATAEITGEMPQVDGGGELHRSEAAGQNGHTNGRPPLQHGMSHQLPSIRFSAHQDPRANRPSLSFNPMARILPTGGEIIKVGRYSERDNQPSQAANVPSAAAVGFKSKVVSRRHCEFWCSGGVWYIKDVKSSSGTFLNHIRLSPPGTESKEYPVKDGDIVQLGIDFKGGEEAIFRCVKIRVELNKGWQSGPSSFNVQSHKRLRELNNNQGKPPASGSSQDCSICLGPIAPCQSLFVAPCSHTWHYKCIRVIINGPHWPHFVCPNCRSVADLEAELEDPANAEWEEVQAEAASPMPLDGPIEPPIPTRTHQATGTDSTEAGGMMFPKADSDSEPDHLDHSDEVEEASDVSSQEAHQAAEDLRYLHIKDYSPSPATSSDSHPPQHISNSTVPPVNISRRGTHLEQPDPRSRTRTPSPNGLPSSLSDVLVGTEGPMTPRNDAGPFVFDGSAGRPSDVRLAALASMNAAPSPPRSTPQAQPQLQPAL